MRKSAVGCLLLFAFALLPAVRLMAKGPTRVASVEGITEYRLDNGLQVLLFPDASKPTVTVNLTIFVGSRHEGYGEAGMAHLLEHMLFKGTPTHEKIPKLLQQRGANFNGTTWVDRTNYWETLPATDENLEFAIRLEADRMINSYIKGADLASEMTVVRNEFERGENSPNRVLRQRMAGVAYEWHNYGKSTIGNRSDIERVPLPKLRDFYRRHYQPDNAMLVVAGRFDQARALALVEEHFGSIPRPERELDQTYTEEPAQDGERQVVLRRVGDLGLVGVSYHVPAGAHPEFAAVDILSYILATEPAGRLYKALVESKKAASVSGGTFAWHDPGMMFFIASVRDAKTLDDVLATVIEETERIGKEGVTQEEVDRVIQQVLKEREISLADSSRIAIELSEWAAQGDWRLFFLYRDNIEKVTPAQVQEVAARYLRRNNRTVGIFIPTDEAERVKVPSTPDVTELVKNYKGREIVAAGEQFDPSPANIEQRTERTELAGGLKVALLPKKTRGEAVRVRLTLRYGGETNLKGLDAACSLLPELMARGTKKLSYQQLQDELDKNRATFSASGSTGSASFSLQTKRPQLPHVLGLLAQVLREPSLPTSELEVIRRQTLAGLESAKSNPQVLARTKLSQRLTPYPKTDVRYVPSVAEQIEMFNDVSLDDIKRVYDEFLSGQYGELAVVGDFDPAEVKQIANQMMDSWVADKSYSRIDQRAFPDVKGTHETILTPDKANAVYYSGMTMPIKDTDADYAPLLIGNFILGGGSLSSRLGDRVRQKDGLSYGVGSGFTASSFDEYGRLTIGAISNPENSPKVVKAISEEVDLLLKKGVTKDELDRAKSGYLQKEQVQRTNDGALASILNRTSHVGRTMKHYEKLEKTIADLTPEQVVAALRKHVDPKRFIVITAGDFEKEKDK